MEPGSPSWPEKPLGNYFLAWLLAASCYLHFMAGNLKTAPAGHRQKELAPLGCGSPRVISIEILFCGWQKFLKVSDKSSINGQ